MIDLTEQWKKGELKLDTNYYILLNNGKVEIQMYVGGFLTNIDNPVVEVLDEVPSYEMFQEFKNANDSMFDTVKMLNNDNSKLEKENAKLKELLKEIRHITNVDDKIKVATTIDYTLYYKLIEKIDEVLK